MLSQQREDKMKNPKHEKKRKAERKLMHKLGIGSEVWQKHKEAIRKRVAKQQKETHERALKRKEAKKLERSQNGKR